MDIGEEYRILDTMSSGDIKTRVRILDATWKLMEKQRGQGVRMGDIAKAAGVSRQAVYLHFESRIELMRATTQYVDERLGLDERIAHVKAAGDGGEALARFVEMWGNYMPEIYGLAKALLAVRDSDEAAAEAWDECMGCLRDAGGEIVDGLIGEGVLRDGLGREEAVALLWTMLSIQNWEQLTVGCGWSQGAYVERMRGVLGRVLID